MSFVTPSAASEIHIYKETIVARVANCAVVAYIVYCAHVALANTVQIDPTLRLTGRDTQEHLELGVLRLKIVRAALRHYRSLEYRSISVTEVRDSETTVRTVLFE